MQFDFALLSSADRYKLLVSTVVPRPIALVTTIDTQGRVNAAPFSFFNVFGSDPATVVLGIGHRSSGAPKDTCQNILDTKEFVVNLVSYSLAAQMNITAAPFPPGTDELKEAGFTSAPSESVAPPRIVECPVAFECKLTQHLPLNDSGLIIGEVLRMYVHDEAVTDAARHHIDVMALDLIGRMEGPWYARTTERFELPRPTIASVSKQLAT